TEIPDQELLHKAHFLILQSVEDVSNFVIGLKSGVKTRREAYKDDPFILAKHANQIWNEFRLMIDMLYGGTFGILNTQLRFFGRDVDIPTDYDNMIIPIIINNMFLIGEKLFGSCLHHFLGFM
ncbi:hypothetical protein ACJX0J_020073, partial [Zea mays]